MAKRYAFRLETLLRLREQREDECKRVVAARLRKIRTVEQHKQVLEEQIVEQVLMLRELLGGSRMEVDLLKSARHWLLRLRRGVLESEIEVAAHRTLLAQERQALAAARKEAKVLEKLKERQYETYRAEAERQERIESDDMSVTRFVREVLVGSAEQS